MGVSSFKRDRNRRGGGVAVYVSDGTKCQRRSNLEHEAIEALWLEVKVSKKQLLVCNLYRPPDAKSEWMEDLTEMVELATQEEKPMVVMGDFNCDMLRSSSPSRRLAMVMSEYGLSQVVKGPTRVTDNSSTQIDLLFITNVDLLRRVGCEELGLSDHSLIYGQLTCTVESKKHTLRFVRCLGKCSADELVADLDSAPWHVMDSFKDVHSQWEYWKMFSDVVDSHAPLKKARVWKKSLPWISREICAMMRARSFHYTKAKKSKKTEDWEVFRRVRNQLKSCIRKAKLQYFEAVSQGWARNPLKSVEVNRLFSHGNNRQIEAVRTDNGVITDQQLVAEKFGRFFSSTGGIRDEGTLNTDRKETASEECQTQFKFKPVEESDVLTMLESLDPNKACGVDGISAKILQTVAPGISCSLTSLFNASLRTGTIPEEWKSTHVTSVSKGGDSDTVSNFRPISVLPVIVKVFERLVHHQLYSYLQEHHLLSSAQFGFR